jgi:hypothetical protein
VAGEQAVQQVERHKYDGDALKENQKGGVAHVVTALVSDWRGLSAK